MSPIARVMSMARDSLDFAERSLGPLLDLFVRLWLAPMFFLSGMLKAADWDTALRLATYEYPVSWLQPHTAGVLGLAVELLCPPLIAAGLLTRFAAVPLLVLTLVTHYAYRALPDQAFIVLLLGRMVLCGAGALSLDRLIGPSVLRSALPFAGLGRRCLDLVDRFGVPLALLALRLLLAQRLAAYGTPATIGAVLLGLGLGTRFVAPVLVFMPVTMAFSGTATPEHAYWLLCFLLLALYGGGVLSVDELLDRLLRRHYPQLDGRPAFSLADAPRVVIVGAGFGGLAAARALRWVRAQVTIIDRRNYHLFQPLLYQVATASLSPADVATPIRDILRGQFNTTVLYGRVTGIDTADRVVLIGDRRIPYDYLVLAAGARHDYFGKDDWEQVAPGLKKIDDATAIRRRILTAFEAAESCDDPDERTSLLTFVVVGAGPTGVELAGAIAELARQGLSGDFRRFDPSTARIILVQSGDRVLPAFPESLSHRAKTALEELGVEVRLNCRVLAIDDAGVMVGNDRIAARTVLWAAGVAASPAAKWLGAAADRAGRLKVLPDLSVPALPQVFAIGDTAMVEMADGKSVPGLAPAAQQGGEYVARVIRAQIENRHLPKPFLYRHRGSMATIGRKAAVADFGAIRLWGALAWWL